MSAGSDDKISSQMLSLSKSLTKLYDGKQFKKGLKVADQILREFPKHGKTLSMKALILSALNRKKEAFICARNALRYDMKNDFCWQIMGTLYKTEKNYYDAAIYLETAFLLQPENQAVIRELTNIYSLIRNWSQNLKLRHQLFKAKPGQQVFLGYVSALHLAKEYEEALVSLDAFFSNNPPLEKFEYSELLFYKNMIIEESGDIAKALENLNDPAVSKKITDKEELKIKNAQYLDQLGRKDEATQQWRVLIRGNPENVSYHEGLLRTLGMLPPNGAIWKSWNLGAAKTKEVVELYDALIKENPTAKICKQIPLSFLSGAEFKERLKKFIYPHLTKGVPTLFSLVKHLYSDNNKVVIITEVMLDIETNLLKLNKLSPSETEEEPPSSLLFTYLFLGYHFKHLHNHQKALEYADKCIEHTPTVLDFYVLKAKIYQDAGNPELASIFMEEARSYDLADRYLNTKSTIYFLRANKVEDAEATITTITRTEERSPSHKNNILDMQVIWYETAEAHCFLRQKEYGKAIKRFMDIEKHFLDFYSDQLDFINFCLRKMTLRQYTKFLRFEENIYSQKFYVHAIIQIVKIYLHLHHNPWKDKKAKEEEYIATLSLPERKKYLNKQKKEEARKLQVQEIKPTGGPQTKKIEEDPDPNGEYYLKEKEPVNVANKYLSQLREFAPNNFTVQILSIDAALIRKKYLIALKSILKAIDLKPNSPKLHERIVRFFHQVSLEENLQPTVAEMVEIHKNTILKGSSLHDFNELYLKENSTTLAGRFAYYQSAILLKPDLKPKLLKLILDPKDSSYGLEASIEVHDYLSHEFPNELESFKGKSHSLYPYSTFFGAQTTVENISPVYVDNKPENNDE